MGLFGRSAKWSKMAVFSAGAKIIKPSGEKANEFELSISQALLELEINSELKNQLRELFITGAKEIDVCGNKKAIVIFVPVPHLRAFQKVQCRLVRELEKKFSGKHVVFVAQRRILPKPTRKCRTKNKQRRPRSRTLTRRARLHPGGPGVPLGDRGQEDPCQAGRDQDHQGAPGEEPADPGGLQDGHLQRSLQETDRQGGPIRVPRVDALGTQHSMQDAPTGHGEGRVLRSSTPS